MTGHELAEWFNITYKYYSNNRKQYLNKLKEFAEFKEIYGGVEILDIKIDIYVKNLNDDVEKYLDSVKNANDHITSISGMAEEWQQTDFQNCPFSTLKRRVRKAGEKAFGITVEQNSRGCYGSREYIWCIKNYSGPNKYRQFTDKEAKLFDELTEYFYKSDAKKAQKLALLDDIYENAEDEEMTKEDYFRFKSYINDNKSFKDIIQKFKDTTGKQIVRATQHDIDTVYLSCAWDNNKINND